MNSVLKKRIIDISEELGLTYSQTEELILWEGLRVANWTE